MAVALPRTVVLVALLATSTVTLAPSILAMDVPTYVVDAQAVMEELDSLTYNVDKYIRKKIKDK